MQTPVAGTCTTPGSPNKAISRERGSPGCRQETLVYSVQQRVLVLVQLAEMVSYPAVPWLPNTV